MMRKIKILHTGMSSNLGGIEKFLIDMYRNIDRERFEIKFLVFSDGKPCFYDEIKDNVIYITSRAKNYIKFINEMKNVLKSEEFDYIHFNLMEFSCFERIILAQKYSNAKIILHSHIADNRLYSFKTKILNKLGEIKILKKENYIKLACSRDAGNDMFKKFKNKNFSVINNGIDLQKFVFSNEKRHIIREELSIGENELLIGHVGRFVEQKNHEYLIEIFKEVKKINKTAKLLLIGKGPLKEKIKEKCAKLELLDSIIFLEDIYNVNDYMSAMDAFVFPSLFEGLGIVLIEAQTSGLNCYITDSLPIEVNVTNKIKRISLKESPQKWAKIIKKSLERNQKINKELIEFDIKETTKKIMEVYENEE